MTQLSERGSLLNKSQPSSFVVYFVAASYVFFGALTFALYGIDGSLLFSGVGAIAAIGGFAVMFRQPWSAYIMLVASFFVVARLAYGGSSFVHGNIQAFEDLPLVLVLLPGTLLMFAAIASPYLVFRYFDYLHSS